MRAKLQGQICKTIIRPILRIFANLPIFKKLKNKNTSLREQFGILDIDEKIQGQILRCLQPVGCRLLHISGISSTAGRPAPHSRPKSRKYKNTMFKNLKNVGKRVPVKNGLLKKKTMSKI